MANEIYGPYQSIDEAVRSVEVIELKGHKSENITLFTNKNNADELQNYTDVTVESDKSTDDTEQSVMDKIKMAVLMDEPDTNTELHEKLTKQGLSNEQATKYKEEIKSGNIIIVADDELKMGNDATPDTVKMEEEVIRRNG